MFFYNGYERGYEILSERKMVGMVRVIIIER